MSLQFGRQRTTTEIRHPRHRREEDNAPSQYLVSQIKSSPKDWAAEGRRFKVPPLGFSQEDLPSPGEKLVVKHSSRHDRLMGIGITKYSELVPSSTIEPKQERKLSKQQRKFAAQALSVVNKAENKYGGSWRFAILRCQIASIATADRGAVECLIRQARATISAIRLQGGGNHLNILDHALAEAARDPEDDKRWAKATEIAEPEGSPGTEVFRWIITEAGWQLLSVHIPLAYPLRFVVPPKDALDSIGYSMFLLDVTKKFAGEG